MLRSLTYVIRTYTCRRRHNIVWQMSSLLLRKLDTNLYKKVTSVIRTCQTTSRAGGTSGTSGTCGTNFEEHVAQVVLQVHVPNNLIGKCQTISQCLPGASICNTIFAKQYVRMHVAHILQIKNPRISTRVRQVVAN